MQEGELSRFVAQLGVEFGDKTSVVVINCESIDLGTSVIGSDAVGGAFGVPAAFVKLELGLGGEESRGASVFVYDVEVARYVVPGRVMDRRAIVEFSEYPCPPCLASTRRPVNIAV